MPVVFLHVWMILVIILGPVWGHASFLSDTANAMPTGTWAVLNTIHLTPEYFQAPGGNGDPSLRDLQRGVWDEISGKIVFAGAGRFNLPLLHIYTESTNTWTKGSPLPVAMSGYGHNAVNVAGRTLGFVAATPLKLTMYWYAIDTDTWTKKATFPNFLSDQTSQSAGAVSHGLAYFPSRDRWYFVDGMTGRLLEYDGNTDAWSTFATKSACFAETGAAVTGYFDDFIWYSPSQNELLFGGGRTASADSSASCRMDSNGVITVNPLAPVSLRAVVTTGSEGGLIAVDPVSGDLLILTQHGELYRLDRLTLLWSLVPNHLTMPPGLQEATDNVVNGFVVSITTYGVLCYYNWSTNQAVLYKHAS